MIKRFQKFNESNLIDPSESESYKWSENIFSLLDEIPNVKTCLSFVDSEVESDMCVLATFEWDWDKKFTEDDKNKWIDDPFDIIHTNDDIDGLEDSLIVRSILISLDQVRVPMDFHTNNQFYLSSGSFSIKREMENIKKKSVALNAIKRSNSISDKITTIDYLVKKIGQTGPEFYQNYLILFL